MTAPFGYYDESLPPELWDTPPLVGAAPRRDAAPEAVEDGRDEPAPPGLVATVGTAEGEPLPEVDPSSYPPGAVELEAPAAPARQRSTTRKRRQ